MRFFSIAPWLGSKLATVADSGLWIGYSFALAAGNRYKVSVKSNSVQKTPALRILSEPE